MANASHHTRSIMQNGAISYVEGSAPVLLDADAVVQPGGNYKGETLSVSGLLSGDVIGFSGGVSVAGNTITIGSNKVATFTGGTDGSDLVITFGRGIVAHDVEALLRNLTYSDSGDGTTPSHVLSFDLAGTVQTELVTIVATNVAPNLDLNGAAAGTSTAQSYIENAAPKVIAPDALVSDANSVDFNGGSLTVAFTANGTAADQLAIGNQGTGLDQIGISGNTITYGGVAIGTFSGGTDGSPLNIAFQSGAATPAAAEALVRDILYSNSSDNPSTADRTITYTLDDGDGASGGHNLASATATIHVTAVDDPPVGVNDTGSATEKGGVDNTLGGADATGNVLLNDTDPDDANASLAVTSIRTGAQSDTGTPGAVGVALAGAHGTLTMNSDGTYDYVVNDNDSAVQALNTGGTLSDTFTYTVADPGGLFSTAELVITVHGANDAPTTTPVTLTPIVEDSGARLITQAELLANASDVDSPTLTATGLSIASGAGTLVDNGDGTWSYTPAAHDDSFVDFSYTVSDGALTASGTASLDITPAGQYTGPAINLTDPISGTQGQTTEHWDGNGTRLFLTTSSTLTADDTDGGVGTDVYSVDLATGAKTLLTASVPGGFEGDSWVEATSPDGTKVVIGSTSTLTPDDTDAGNVGDFYLYDFATGTKTLLTEPVTGAHGDSAFMGWSPDGTTLLLQSTATLTADDTDNGAGYDIFAVNAATGAKTLLTASIPGGAEGSFSAASWSPDGSKLVIQSTASLTADDTDNGAGGGDLFSVDMTTGTKTLLTASIPGGLEGSSQIGAWSPDGSKIAFTSTSQLTADASNDGVGDVYVADIGTGEKTLLSAPVAGGFHGDSEVVGWSPDSATLLISSTSPLTANDGSLDTGVDLFAVDIASGQKTLLTESVPGGTEGDSWLEGWSPDGAKIVIGSTSTLTPDDTDGGAADLYAVDLTSGQKTLLTAPIPGGVEGSVKFAGWSPDGTKALIAATSTLTPDDTNGTDWDLYSVDVATGVKTLLTAPVAGGVEGDSDFVFDVSHGSPTPVWSADGQSVRVVTSAALVNGDTDNGGEDLYWINVNTGVKTLTDLGVDAQPNQHAWAETSGHDGATLVGIATDVSDFYLLV